MLISMPFLYVAWAAILTAMTLSFVYARRGARVRERLELEHQAQFEAMAPIPDDEMPWLQRWLFVAGFRRQSAAPLFLGAATFAVLLGVAVATTMRASRALFMARLWLYDLPGGIGSMLDPIILLAPWFMLIVIATLPWILVRSARRRRVREIEEDLPITLQLLATLARAGLGFDASLMRVLDSSDAERTLPQELQAFRNENMAGLPRTHCWRRLARRVEVSAVSIFVSAMVHAEQVGGGVSHVLEHQTEDVQSRRRERALIKAQSLPVKLVFPLVICFLPGIFVWTLGPAFYQFLEIIDGVMRDAGG